MFGFIKNALGLSENVLGQHQPILNKINSYEDFLLSQDDGYLSSRLAELGETVQDQSLDIPTLQKQLDEILPEVFAIVREASSRVLNMKHYPVQLVGGIVLHKNRIAEMRTGEGKTLVATCPAVLNALTKRGVHIVTVNDYLASRDSEWMGRLYKFLGLSVGLIVPGQNFEDKQAAYQADILYSTNNELGFDYLRDNMATSLEQQVRRAPYFAIVDEVDSVLVDEARTPLIISGSPEANKQQLYVVMHRVAQQLTKGKDVDDQNADYYLDEKAKNVILTDVGIKKSEKTLGGFFGVESVDLWDVRANFAHHLLQALKAQEFFGRDTDYVVEVNKETGKKEIVIVDEFTGRLMHGRRWSDGLHQAVEAKENVPIQEESLTLASITFQNFFRLYPKLAGMTGTAKTEEEEFRNIYNLSVSTIPTNKPSQRQDYNDKVFKDQQQKFYAILEEIIKIHKQKRPILVGTTSIEKSELLSEMLSAPQKSVNLLKKRAQRLMDLLATQYSQAEYLQAQLKKIMDRPVNIKYSSIVSLLNGILESDEYKAQLAGDLLHAIEMLVTVQPEDIETSDKDSKILTYLKTFLSSIHIVETIRQGVDFNVLNAKHHAQEAQIIAQAGRLGAITIATNMAGRGTDIVLGGNPEYIAHQEVQKLKLQKGSLDYEAALGESLNKLKAVFDEEQQQVIACGGLHVIGSERHESRRIDNQLRGRASRQGDPGSTRFFLALDDQLMRIFGGERMAKYMQMMKADDDLSIEASFVNKAIESAQKKVEAHNYEIRKRLLEYDDVSNTQRQWVYEQRQKVLEGYDLTETFRKMLEEQIERIVFQYLDPEKPPEYWYDNLIPEDADVSEISDEELKSYPRPIDLMLHTMHMEFPTLAAKEDERLQSEHFSEMSFAELLMTCKKISQEALVAKEEELTSEIFKEGSRFVFLKSIDDYWVEHLGALDTLREGIHLRGYGNKQPVVEYKREAFEMFDNHLYQNIRRQAIQWIFHVERVSTEDVPTEAVL